MVHEVSFCFFFPYQSLNGILFIEAEKREWSYLHRYGFHTFYLEDGTKGNVGIVSQPVTCSV